MKKSALEAPLRLRVQGRALVGNQGAKLPEAQRIWALRISYMNLKSVIFC